MKTTWMEKIFAILAVAFVGGTAAYFLLSRPVPGDYRVAVEREGVAQDILEPSPAPVDEGEKVDLNTADVLTLQTLPGIGEKRAKDIVADRERNGPFRIPEDLTRVPGIGEGTLEGLLDYVTVG